ncbi:hypothetical protein BGHDH14_bghG002135000003001 [Blumeria hordei DH14]|uniref:Uncharacterized protein n=1 Tax=Blumeria graminis f. sp. hordei (strain DH14) TaxID=546991 RepID=N1J7V5_BLUG1|nr:hypothetical protein BGHDH14_bghG002135000003001 [Blumeria hordei DH14]
MEPIEPRRQLLKRYYCDFDGYCYRTSWDVWGRWVASAIIVITIVLLAFLFSQGPEKPSTSQPWPRTNVRHRMDTRL